MCSKPPDKTKQAASYADVGKAQALLEWRSNITLEQGLRGLMQV